MNDQERQVISDIFQRLEQVAQQPRDPEAERFIADKVRQQPYAPYAMAQSLYVQEQALLNLKAENEQLQAEVERLRRQPQQGGFLSGIFGGGGARPAEPSPGSPWGRPGPQPMPGGQGPQPMGPQPMGPQPMGPQAMGMQQPGPMGGAGPWGGRPGGGFLQSAMTTAAGVAGGMVLANALSHAFGGESGAGASAAAGLAGLGGLGEGKGGEPGSSGDITDPLYQNADHSDQGDDSGNDDSGDDDSGGDDGGDGGDWL